MSRENPDSWSFRAGFDKRHGDLSSTYGRGDNFCSAGYYHGAMETFVAKIGADKILEEAGALCAGLGGWSADETLSERIVDS